VLATILLVALSVGLDNLGAATAIGTSGVTARLRLRVAAVFGLFEAAMPVLGILLGHSVAASLGGATKAVAGGVLCAVGAYTIISELASHDDEDRSPAEPSMRRLLILGVALSLDNLAIGFALGAYPVNIFLAALVIGVVSVALTLLGLELGQRIGSRLGRWSEVFGGGVLIAVGLAVATGVL
jgi:putative Mn2+ efflux pump MntP